MEYPTPLLYHGPSALGQAIRTAESIGHLDRDPFGSDGIKIDEAREIVSLLDQRSVGSRVRSLVIGPLDRSQGIATDVLLKSLEGFDPEVGRPVLWAWSLEGVSPTIRSRTWAVWAPGEKVLDEDLLIEVKYLVRASLRQDAVEIVQRWGEMEVTEDFLLCLGRAVLDVSGDLKGLSLWSSLRPILQHQKPTKHEVLTALL